MAIDALPTTGKIYPYISVDYITNPSKLYAIPVIGFLIKIVILIPMYFFMFACAIATMALVFANSFAVLFTGKYLQTTYEFVYGFLCLATKVSFFFSGVTNTYPDFSLKPGKEFTITTTFPKNPNRWFAFPILGGVARILLLIPFYIFYSVLKNATQIAVFWSWIPVLFQGRYPETTVELQRDTTRVSFALTLYFSGVYDSYPNFWISMHHKNLKTFLIVVGALLLFLSYVQKVTSPQQNYRQHSSGSYRVLSPQGVTPTAKNVPYNY